MHISGLRQEGRMLPVSQLPFVDAAVAGVLFPAGSRKDLRPQLRRLCKGLEAVESCRLKLAHKKAEGERTRLEGGADL